MSSIPLIYVAGPFRGKTHWEVESNIRRAEEISLRLWKLGVAVFCPHTNTRYFDQEIPDDHVLASLLDILDRCDALFVLKGWENSSGTQEEIKQANFARQPIFYEEVETWEEEIKDYIEDYKETVSLLTS